MQSYREELQQHLVKLVTLSVTIVASIIFLCVMTYFYIDKNTQLKTDTSDLATTYQDRVSAGHQLLADMLAIDADLDRNIYYQFYTSQARHNLDGNFILMDAQGKQLFSNADQSLADTYRQLLVTYPQQSGSLTYYDTRGKCYQLLFQKNHQEIAAYLMPAENIFAKTNLEASSFALQDQYGHFLTQSPAFPDSQSNCKQKFYLKGKQVYLLNHAPLPGDMVLLTATLFMPAMLLFVLALAGLLALILALTSVAAYVAGKMAAYSSQSVDQLVAETRAITDGSQQAITGQYEQEFSYLSQAMNDMLAKIKQLNEDQLTLEIDKLNYERKMLEAQFNPHFLYNTLETIRITSQFDSQVCNQLIKSLTKILRYGLDADMDNASLGEDLDIIDHFLQVNQTRFPNFSYDIKYPAKLADIPVPRLFLLSAIENAIKYGRNFRPDLQIKVLVREHSPGIDFCIWDNGPGFSHQAQVDLAENLKANTGQDGLMNSIKRLRYLYPEAELHLEPSETGSLIIYRIGRR
ncbi:hypothetical protein AWM75_08360 [Aerococcus urinaehominis]|uniref:Uncharacterized protein n=1 Tax=Aerococcus urinaehominis TaxID=128944 RepID=A0A0X8FNN1_9LACT|nr:histidine kinase [Aerococcus urinaehominis]AMB99982.1 hypothetical protein AWM75_08360 [Aerococcus urinaehominis]SDM45611.1 Histidine kinase [Aerococcus urinaehominis]